MASNVDEKIIADLFLAARAVTLFGYQGTEQVRLKAAVQAFQNRINAAKRTGQLPRNLERLASL
jgi:hypothetical protein